MNYHRPCSHYDEQHGTCGDWPTRAYLVGRRCEQHTPAKLAGRDETRPDPALTMHALMAQQRDITQGRAYGPEGTTDAPRLAADGATELG